jgi:hypothetical protein
MRLIEFGALGVGVVIGCLNWLTCARAYFHSGLNWRVVSFIVLAISNVLLVSWRYLGDAGAIQAMLAFAVVTLMCALFRLVLKSN